MSDTLIARLAHPAEREAAFSELVHCFTPPLYAVIRRLVIWHDDADDVLQETFLKAWAGVENFKGESSLYSWLYRIAVNESLTFLNRRKRCQPLSETEEGLAESLEADPYFDGEETERQLQEAISQLPEKQRVVFNMKYFDELKYEEMAAILDTSVGALKASYHIAVKKVENFFHRLD